MATATRIGIATASRATRYLYLLLQGQFVTHMGNQIHDIAMLLWIKEVTGSASLMGLALLLTNPPHALLGPLGGKLADRFGNVRTMVTADLASALTVGLVALTIWWPAEPLVMVLALGAGNLVLGVASSCFNPAVLSLIPVLPPGSRLAKGNAAHQSSRMGGQILGQGLAGVLFSALGTAGAFFVNALSFFVSALTEVGIRVPGADSRRRPASAGSSKTTNRRIPEPESEGSRVGLELLAVSTPWFLLLPQCAPLRSRQAHCVSLGRRNRSMPACRHERRACCWASRTAVSYCGPKPVLNWRHLPQILTTLPLSNWSRTPICCTP